MEVKLIEAMNDEKKEAKNGLAGDQLNNVPGKGEVRIGPWRIRPGGWEGCLECTDVNIAKKAAGIFSRIANDASFGYDQNQRWTALEAIRKAGGNIEEAEDSEIDCSSGVDISYILAGLNVERGYTGNIVRRYLATGKFILHTDEKYLTSGDYAKTGWLYFTSGKHVAMVMNDGPKATISETPAIVQNGVPLIKQNGNVVLPYVEALRAVRIRKGPSLKEASLGYIAKKTKVAYITKVTKYDKDWYYIDTLVGHGYVSADPSYTRLVDQ